MLFQSSCLTALLVIGSVAVSAQECSTTWMCRPTTTAPVLDADHGEWADVEAYKTTIIKTLTDEVYDAGDAVYKCLYDDEHIYFALEIPGEYRFSTEDNKLCAAIGTMFKIGEKATYKDMGGCPDAMGGCADGVPDTCTDYLVDVGAHWELKGTQQNTMYGVSDSAAAAPSGNSTDPIPAPGNDLIANKDDEYAVSSFCRFDDDDANAGNEWAGAWAHTNPVEGASGTYHFEMSRKLKTASMVSDAQLAAGDTMQFGVAFWDPFENSETGWTDAGHYVTGCGTKWIDLQLATTDAPAPADGSDANAETDTPSGARATFGVSTAAFLFFLVGIAAF